MRVLAFVSDEMYVAIPDVQAEFQLCAGGDSTVLRSSPRGAFYGELADGEYTVTLAKSGFGSKIVKLRIGSGEPHQIRLLSDCLLGYAWPKWVRSGETAEYRVHSPEPYQLTLWRYGWKKEFVNMLGWLDEHGPGANRQILPDGDFTQTGANWNQEGYASPPTTTAPQRSGLYYFWARTASGKSFSFPWVVAPARPQCKLAVLASTNCWNAYNNFGGRSNYVNADHLPANPIVNARQELDRYQDPTPFGSWKPKDEEYLPLSFDRPEPHNHIFDDPKPTDPVQGRVQCGLAPAEWRLYAWLEREGIEYDLYAEGHLHRGEVPLDEYSVLVIAVHPEYWSREMYLAVKDWVFHRGGKLMYLGGNGLNCEVTLTESGQMRCLSHVNSVAGELGGFSDDGSTEYESRMHRTLESEANLLGVVCTVSGIMTAAPYRVMDDSHWIFEGTGVKNGQLFGEHTLHERIAGGASGHETDKRSVSSPLDTVLLAKGTNPDDGGSEIVVHQPGNGGAVFSVGSITWVSALFTDSVVATVTRNVLTKFLQDERSTKRS